MSAQQKMVRLYDRLMRNSRQRRYYGNSDFYNFGYWGAGAKTQRERDYIDALLTFYTDYDKIDHRTRVQSYLKAMEALATRYPDDDDQADKYELADALLTAAGLVNYEISNWARPGHQCRHNLLYWSQGDYAGFGCAAHSHRAGRRWWNVRTPERYLDRVESGRSAEAGGEDPGHRPHGPVRQ